MKKTIISIFLLTFLYLGFSSANSNLEDAVSWMHSKGLTIFDNPTDFMAEKSLRRDEASKFFVQYAKEVMELTPDVSKTSCNFTDLNQARPDLKDLIKESCQLGLFQGHNGKFMPTQSLTNAQAITVLIRMIDGQKDESQGHFGQKYFEKAQELGIMEGLLLNSTTKFDKLTTRGDVGILIFNTSELDDLGRSDWEVEEEDDDLVVNELNEFWDEYNILYSESEQYIDNFAQNYDLATINLQVTSLYKGIGVLGDIFLLLTENRGMKDIEDYWYAYYRDMGFTYASLAIAYNILGQDGVKTLYEYAIDSFKDAKKYTTNSEYLAGIEAGIYISEGGIEDLGKNEDDNINVLSDGTKVYKNSVCGHVYYWGPRGGCYYINSSGIKVYDSTKACCSN